MQYNFVYLSSNVTSLYPFVSSIILSSSKYLKFEVFLVVKFCVVPGRSVLMFQRNVLPIPSV